MRALVGLDPRAGGIGHEVAVLFERGLRFYDTESWRMLLRYRLDLVPSYALEIAKVPTLSPEGGLPMVVSARGRVAPARATVSV